MAIENYDEVDFTDGLSGSPAYMHLGRSGSGEMAIRLFIVNGGVIDLTVTVTPGAWVRGWPPPRMKSGTLPAQGFT